MFNYYAIALISAAFVTMGLSMKTPRSWMWVGVGGASFVASSLYWDFGDRQFHPIFTFSCDALVCLSLHVMAKEKWELIVFACFLLSCFMSILRIAGFVPGDIMYASMLEVCNWAALFVVGGVGLLDMVRRNGDGLSGSLHRSLHSARNSV